MKPLLVLAAFLGIAASAVAQSVPVRSFEGAKGYQQALELQEKTNLPILVWATWSDCPNCSGVTAYINRGKPRQTLKDFIRVVVDEHGREADAAFAKEKGFHGGTFYVIPPGGGKPTAKVWAWEGESRDILPDLETVLVEKLNAAKGS